ncbi:Gfo/Idh/MocA family oxidoreductase [Gracilibacillus caseinilyticus]|uniref:Gfo/Idh/MocA family oxidoreductase n=1 Tax=Gracilibacillus caseinilyticus TaxID=2932256 RepID=A0ABY4F021_9BACI|nr:Gfo/Idh/MocA family oxidoreductase [Gracilibacillus caseinilyticus]UOQ50002.1 Gfo/Idh/MocA family oxidoreductase [Gracilibacillus caseinilyticus]
MLRIGFIGTGGFTNHHVQVLQGIENVEVAGFVGSSLEKAEQFAAQYTGAVGYSQLETMLEQEQLDAVYICVPPMAHKNYEALLIDYGIPFLVEKPLGIDVQQVRKVKEKVEQHQHLTAVGYHLRYSDTIARVQELLKNAETAMAAGKWMGSMPGVYWWRNQEQSGGQFNEQTTHITDLIRYLFGEVKAVYAQETNQCTNKKDPTVTVADVGLFTLTMESGMLVQIMNTSALPNGTGDVGIEIYTDQGIIDWKLGHVNWKFPGKQERYDQLQNPYKRETEAFLHAVATGDRSKILSTYEDSWYTFKVTAAAEKSLEEKRVVDVNEIE